MAPPNHSHPDIERSIGRLEGKVETLKDVVTGGFERIDQRLSHGETRFQKQNSQIGKLGGKHQWILGGLAMLVFLTPLVILAISYLT